MEEEEATRALETLRVRGAAASAGILGDVQAGQKDEDMHQRRAREPSGRYKAGARGGMKLVEDFQLNMKQELVWIRVLLDRLWQHSAATWRDRTIAARRLLRYRQTVRVPVGCVEGATSLSDAVIGCCDSAFQVRVDANVPAVDPCGRWTRPVDAHLAGAR